MITIIAALTRNRVIGRDGGIPWHIPEDLKLFRKTTLGHAVVMGRNTFQSLKKPLDGRLNIVISTTLRGTEEVNPEEVNRSGKPEDPDTSLIICPTFKEAIAAARRRQRDIFITGGTEVYRQALPIADRMLLSLVFQEYEGDTYFPLFDEGEWKKTTSQRYSEFELVVYDRIVPTTL
jgi:dihydrofolate reductase